MQHFRENKVDAGDVAMWKVASMGFILTKMRPNKGFDFTHLFILMYMAHFKYLNTDTLINQGVFKYLTERYLVIVMRALIKNGFVERIDLNLADIEFENRYPKYVYKLSLRGKRTVNKIHRHLDGTEEFSDFDM